MSRDAADCPHIDVTTFGDAEGGPRLWACAECSLRFYPACRTCVDVGHRNIEHPTLAPAASEPGLREMLEATRAELDGCRRWFAFAVAASGGISIPDKALMFDAPPIEKSYDPIANTTTFRTPGPPDVSLVS